ncbi:MAG: hypothetical protein ACLP7F_03395, partial [Acidimicrobiales bacterium]
MPSTEKVSLPARLRSAIVDDSNPSSFAARTRARRSTWLLERFPDLCDMRVLDLGGRAATWEQLPVSPAEVVILNSSDWHSGVADAQSE